MLFIFFLNFQVSTNIYSHEMQHLTTVLHGAVSNNVTNCHYCQKSGNFTSALIHSSFTLYYGPTGPLPAPLTSNTTERFTSRSEPAKLFWLKLLFSTNWIQQINFFTFLLQHYFSFYRFIIFNWVELSRRVIDPLHLVGEPPLLRQQPRLLYLATTKIKQFLAIEFIESRYLSACAFHIQL